MKQLFSFAIILLAALATCFANAQETRQQRLSNCIGYNLQLKQKISSESTELRFTTFEAPAGNAESNETSKTVTLTEAGSLKSILGEDLLNVESLTLSGIADDNDIHTLWEASLRGNLAEINMANVSLVNGLFPDNAFWHPEDQIADNGSGQVVIYYPKLRSIVFPDNLTGIGAYAFSYCYALQDIELPSTMSTMGEYCFSDCESLYSQVLVFPEGLEEIPRGAFAECKNLGFTVFFPKSLRRIGEMAFFSCPLGEVYLPPLLEEIKGWAFYGCKLSEITIPPTCLTLSGSEHFARNYMLYAVFIFAQLTELPPGFLFDCPSLKNILLPSSIKTIHNQALKGCTGLPELRLPSNLETLEWEALEGCQSLKTICFPATLKKLGDMSCNGWDSMEKVYCEAAIPPVCEPSHKGGQYTPFGSPRATTPTLYVPEGTKRSYEDAYGWNYFKTIIDNEPLPGANLEEIGAPLNSNEENIYDLNGRKVLKPINGNFYIKAGRIIRY